MAAKKTRPLRAVRAARPRKEKAPPSGLALRIRTMRLEKNITQGAMAAEVGASQSSVSHWEYGSREPTLRQAEKLAKLFGVSVGRLLNGKE